LLPPEVERIADIIIHIISSLLRKNQQKESGRPEKANESRNM